LIKDLVAIFYNNCFLNKKAFNLGTSSPSNPPQLIHENNQEVINPVLDNGVRVIYLDVGQPVKVTIQ
jgi:hypothetical protein